MTLLCFPLLALLVVNFVGFAAQLVLQLVLPRSPTLHLDCKIDSGRCIQPKTLGNLLQIQRIHVENVFLFVTCICLQIGTIAILCCTVQVVVSINELCKLLLDIGELLDRELILVWPYLLLLEESYEAKLTLKDEKQCFPSALRAPAGSPDAMDVIVWVIRGVELNDPVDFREV